MSKTDQHEPYKFLEGKDNLKNGITKAKAPPHKKTKPQQPLKVGITTNANPETAPLIITQTGKTFTGDDIQDTTTPTKTREFKTFRLINGSKNPSSEWKQGKGAKNIYKVQERKKGNNYGVPCGTQNGILVVDIDTYKHPDQFKAEFGSVAEIVKRCNTYTTETPRGGIHLYFKYVEDYKNKPYGAFIDIKTEGGYVVGHGATIKYDKPFYKYHDQQTGDISTMTTTSQGSYKCINEAEPADMPAFIIDYLERVDIMKSKKGTTKTNNNKTTKHTPSIYKYEIDDDKLRDILDNYQPPKQKTEAKPKAEPQPKPKAEPQPKTEPKAKAKGDPSPVKITKMTERRLSKYIKNHLRNIEQRDTTPLIYTILRDRQAWLNFTFCMNALNKPEMWHEYSKKAYGDKWSHDIEKQNQKIYINSSSRSYTDTAFLLFFDSEDVKRMKYKPVQPNIIEPTETINRRYIQDMNQPSIYNISEKCIFVKSDTGTGKTASFNHFIKESGLNFISLTLRVTLAETQYNDMSEAGLTVKNYQIQPRFDDGDNIICQLDSITKINLNKLTLKNYVVFLDEADALLSYMCMSPTLKNVLYPVFKFLVKMLNGAKKIICTDKSLSDMVIKFITHVTEERQYKFIENSFKNWEGIEAKIWHSEKDILDDMKAHNGGFVTATDERRQQIIIDDSLNDSRVNFISKTTTGGLNLDAKKLCFTPKITEGVDIQPAEKCPTYGIYNTTTINARTMFQQLTRNRKPTRLNICFINNRCNCKDEADENMIYDDYDTGHDTTYNIFEVISTPDEARLFYSMRSYYEGIDRAFKTNPKKHLLKLLRDSGFIITDDREIKTDPIMNTKEKGLLNVVRMQQAIMGEHDLLQTPEYERVNELLKLPPKVAYENVTLYTSQTALNQHFNVIKYMTSEADAIKEAIDNRQTFKLLKIRCSDNNIRGLKDIISRCGVAVSLNDMKELTAEDYKYINDIKKSIRTRGKDTGDLRDPQTTRGYICSVIRALFGEGSLVEIGEVRTRKQKDKKQIINKVVKLYDHYADFYKNHEMISTFRKAPAVINKSLFV